MLMSESITEESPYVQDCIDAILNVSNTDEYQDIEAEYGHKIYDEAMNNVINSSINTD